MLQAELKVIEGKQQGKSIPLNARNFLIGREQDCQLRPTSDLVSRHHCVFSQDGYTVRLRDLGSTNGTFVNGERIQGQVVLNDGDRVQIGKLAFQVAIHQTADVAVSGPATAGSAGGLSLDDLSSQPESDHTDSLSDSAILKNAETGVNTGKTEAGSRDSGKTMEIPAYDPATFTAAETEAGMFGGDTTVIAPPQPAAQPVSPLGAPPARYPAQRPPGVPKTPPGGFPQYPQSAGTQPGYAPAAYVPPPPYPMQQPGYAPQPPVYPAYPQAGYPGMTGYPNQPMYQQPAYQQPAYPQPGYPPMQGYPSPAYPQQGVAYPPQSNPYPPQQQAAPAPAPAIESPSTAGKRNSVPMPAVSLPPPEETGAKPPEPKPEEPKAADGSAPAPAKKPSSAAADIIRAHMQRRPGAS